MLTSIVYLVERVDLNLMNDDLDEESFYLVYGYTENESMALAICSTGKVFTAEDYWAIGKFGNNDSIPEFRYRTIPNLQLSIKDLL